MLNIPELLVLLGVSILMLGVFSLVFYDSLWPIVPILPPGFAAAAVSYKISRRKKRLRELKKQFLNAIIILGDYMKSGRSIESGIGASVPELTHLYGKDGDVVREWRRMEAGLLCNRPVEELFSNFGQRSRVSEIRDFAEILQVSKRSGGRLSEVVAGTAEMLSEQFFVNEKIETIVAAKKLEQRIMAIMPIGILAYIRIASPEMLSVMYTTVMGRLIMTGCLAVYVLAEIWAKKITEIEM